MKIFNEDLGEIIKLLDRTDIEVLEIETEGERVKIVKYFTHERQVMKKQVVNAEAKENKENYVVKPLLKENYTIIPLDK